MKQRIITGIVAGSAFIALLVIGGTAFHLLLALAAVVGYYEFAKMNSFRPMQAASIAGFGGVLYFVLPWERLGIDIAAIDAFLWIWMLLFLTITVLSKNKVDLDRVALLFIGMVYVGFGFGHMITTRAMDDGLFLTSLLFASIWASDIGAYFTGMLIGRTPLWPAISPKKTVEGSLGGVLLAMLTAVFFSLLAPERLSLADALLIGAAAALFGQLGDLIQSAYKRIRGVKDSGAILPGHGGVLDRCDSWLIVFPAVHFLHLLPV